MTWGGRIIASHTVLRLVRWSALGVLLVAGGSATASWYARRPPAPLAAGTAVAFDLIDSAGRRVTQEAYPGKWLLVYFGYAYSPDVSPAGLQTIGDALELLGSKADDIIPIFITIDAARDTPSAIGQYVRLFDPRLVGLTGSETQISAAALTFHAFSRRIADKSASNYLFDHSAYVYLISPTRELQMLFKPGVSPADLGRSLDETVPREG